MTVPEVLAPWDRIRGIGGAIEDREMGSEYMKLIYGITNKWVTDILQKLAKSHCFVVKGTNFHHICIFANRQKRCGSFHAAGAVLRLREWTSARREQGDLPDKHKYIPIAARASRVMGIFLSGL